jgi:hypothetical protein
MKNKKFGVLAACAGTIVLSLFYPIFDLLLLLFLSLSLIFLMLVGIVKIFKPTLKSYWYRIPFFIVALAFLGLLVGFIKPLPSPIPKNETSVSEHLAYMRQTDQSDRKNIKIYFNFLVWGSSEAMNRDSIRLNKTLKLIENDTAKLGPEDKYNAAMILQHGEKPEHYKKAHELAAQAAKHKIQNATWLKKAAYDRWQLSIGNEQQYGTQKKW